MYGMVLVRSPCYLFEIVESFFFHTKFWFDSLCALEMNWVIGRLQRLFLRERGVVLLVAGGFIMMGFIVFLVILW